MMEEILVTLTYPEDVRLPDIADTDAIRIIERGEHSLYLGYSCSEKEVIAYLEKTCGLPRPLRISFVMEIDEEEDFV